MLSVHMNIYCYQMPCDNNNQYKSNSNKSNFNTFLLIHYYQWLNIIFYIKKRIFFFFRLIISWAIQIVSSRHTYSRHCYQLIFKETLEIFLMFRLLFRTFISFNFRFMVTMRLNSKSIFFSICRIYFKHGLQSRPWWGKRETDKKEIPEMKKVNNRWWRPVCEKKLKGLKFQFTRANNILNKFSAINEYF